MPGAEFILDFARYYLIFGGLVAALFLVFGIERVEPGSKGAYAFRPLLLPGLITLWPIVLWRWWTLEKGKQSL